METPTLRHSQKSSSYFKDSRGAIAIIFALLLVPFTLVAGMALEVSRASIINTELAYACDAAAVAGARYQLADVATNANKVFLANFSQGYNNVNVTPNVTVSPDNTMVTISVASVIPTYLGLIPGIFNLKVDGFSQVYRTFKNVEVALVLDNTGSMASNGKIQGLRDAASNLINIIFQNQNVSDNDKAVMSIVPYVATVNIGTNHKNWLADPQTINLFPTDEPWAGCVGSVDNYTTMDTDNPPSPSRLWPVYLAASTYKLFGSQDGNNDWQTKKNKLQVMTPISGVDIGPNRSCGLPIQPLTNNRNTLLAKVSAMVPVPGGGTFGNLGLVWGWNTISPKWVGLWGGIDPKPYNTQGYQKYIVIVTDGENQWYANPDYLPNGDPTAYGFSKPKNGNLSQGLLGTTNINNSRTYIDNRLLDLCGRIKAAGIQILTVTFQVSDSLAKQIYQQCATKPEFAFQADNSQQLYDIFSNIGGITQSIVIVK